MHAPKVGSSSPAVLRQIVRSALRWVVRDELDGPTRTPDFSKMTRQQLQEAHEMAVARSTAKIRRASGLAVAELRRGDPAAGEPDAVFRSGKQSVGIEVTRVGYGGVLRVLEKSTA